jgi:hypothetical protein
VIDPQLLRCWLYRSSHTSKSGSPRSSVLGECVNGSNLLLLKDRLIAAKKKHNSNRDRTT